MFGKKKNQTLVKDDVLTPVRATKENDKKRTLRITVFPREGGKPYVVDVVPEGEQGTFTIGEKKDYQVSRGSVWEENGILRAIVNEGNPKTVNAYTLIGDDSMDPVALHGIASNNLWIQLDSLAKRKSVWRSAGTWGLLILGVVVCLLMLWNVKTTGDGFENLRGGLDALRAQQQPPTSAEEAGHQSIAPGIIGLHWFRFLGV